MAEYPGGIDSTGETQGRRPRTAPANYTRMPPNLGELQAAVQKASVSRGTVEALASLGSSDESVKTELAAGSLNDHPFADYFAGATFPHSTTNTVEFPRKRSVAQAVVPLKASPIVSIAGAPQEDQRSHHAVQIAPGPKLLDGPLPTASSTSSTADSLQPARARLTGTMFEYPQYPNQSHAALHAQKYPEPHRAPFAARPATSHAHHVAFGHTALAHTLRDSLSTDRQSQTTANTPVQTPGLFHPRPRQHVWESSDDSSPYPSPYLHPSQSHAPKETNVADRAVDHFSGRKMINQYEIFEELGRGVHGKVKLARNLETSEYVAIKIVQRYSKRRRLGKALLSSEDKVKKEVAILKKALHPHVVSMHEVIDDPEISKIYIVLEFCELREIDWRTKGSSEIVLMENRRLEREAQGLEVGTQNDKLIKAAERRRAKAKLRRPKPMRTITAESEFWSLEYADESDEEEDSAAAPLSAIPSRASENATEDSNSNLAFNLLGPASDRGSPLSSPNPLAILSPTNYGIDIDLPRRVAESVEAQRQLFSSKWLEESTEPLSSMASSTSDFRGRKGSVADSVSSQLTDRMEQEVPDEFQYVPTMTIAESRSAFRDAVLGLEYLHYQGIVHRDIKPANLLRTKDHRVKISDFGVSYLGKPMRGASESEEISESDAVGFEEETELAKTVGTPSFYAPELCSLEFNYDIPIVTGQIDVWALGVTLYCLLYARTPFSGDNEFALMRRIAESNVFISRKRLMAVDTRPSSRSNSRGPVFRFAGDKKRLPHEWIHEEIDDDLYDLLKRLFEKDPTKRITLQEVKHHPWILQDFSNPSQWIDETDPARHTEGKKIEISTEEVAEAVIPLKPVLERARSLVKKVMAFGNIGRGSRKRATSSATSSEAGTAGAATMAPPPDANNSNIKRPSLRTEEAAGPTLRTPGNTEHPLSYSVTASPGTEPDDNFPVVPFADSLPSSALDANESVMAPRPRMPERTSSSMSTAASISTLRAFEGPALSIRSKTPSPPPAAPHGTQTHRGHESSHTVQYDHFSGLRRFGNFSKPNSSRIPKQLGPHQQISPSDLLTPGHLHGEASLAVSSSHVSGHMNTAWKQATAESLDFATGSSAFALNDVLSPSGIKSQADFYPVNPHRPKTPVLSFPVRHRIGPVDPGYGLSRGMRDHSTPNKDANEDDYRYAKDQQSRRRKLEDDQREYQVPAVSAQEVSCPASPDDGIFERPCPQTVQSPRIVQHRNVDTCHSSPRGQHLVSSASSEDPFTSRSTSIPSIPSAVSANSSIMAEYERPNNVKDDSASSSDGTAKANFNEESESFLQRSQAASQDALEIEDPIQTDEDDSDSDRDFIVMSKTKKRLDTKDRDRRGTSISKGGNVTPVQSRENPDERLRHGQSNC